MIAAAFAAGTYLVSNTIELDRAINLKTLLAAMCAATLAYHGVLITQVSQLYFYLLAPLLFIPVYSFIKETSFQEQPLRWNQLIIYHSVVIGAGIMNASVYAFNPDDTTFFHRVAYRIHEWQAAIPVGETRVAFESLPAMSPAHLISSWEFVLAAIGAIFGKPLHGYHVLGSFIAGAFIFSAMFRILRLWDVEFWEALCVTLATTVFLYFDADQNRRIGSWLFIGGWTGKCLLASALILLFPLLHLSWSKNRNSDWALLFCLVVSLTGLTGSSLFILPAGLACGLIAQIAASRLITPSNWKMELWKALRVCAIGAYPVVIGGVAILRFGALESDAYWRTSEAFDWKSYLGIVFSFRHWIIIACFLFCAWIGSLGAYFEQVRISLSYYIIALGLLVINPLLLPFAWKFVPPDGYWRTFYLLQYPLTVAMIFSTAFNLFRERLLAQKRLQWRGIMMLAMLIIIAVLHFRPTHSIYSLQQSWNYERSMQCPWETKLQLKPRNSIVQLNKTVPHVISQARVFLAPEEWEVAAQQLYPSLQALCARHMEHVFAQSPDAHRILSLTHRRGAQRCVTTAFTTADDWRYFHEALTHPIDLLVVNVSNQPRIVEELKHTQRRWHCAYSDESYCIYIPFTE
jgi:hypothetical protein